MHRAWVAKFSKWNILVLKKIYSMFIKITGHPALYLATPPGAYAKTLIWHAIYPKKT